ncbi:lysM domain receptor-like kinase 3 [Cornus florida]|uniref:lysM domain receptor-like kinase 3 n=1 Tax=Cornus florida TaxID=4283 RepID=UPI00289C47B2|nr:lysM domain receptor-like kinase 3 [Cornus florida]
MCKTKMAVNATEPKLTRSRNSGTTRTSINTPSSKPQSPRPSAPISDPSSSNVDYSSTGSSYKLDTSRATTSFSSRTSLSSLRDSLPENPYIYDFAEIRSATNNFLAKRHSSSSSPSWRCTLRDKDVVVFQRKIRRSIETSELKQRLSVICWSHSKSIIKLLGASISGDHIYLVYDFVNGANLSDCLRNPRNPNFTVLSGWMSRMQIAADLAQGLDYIHNNTGLSMSFVHKHVKSSSIIVTEPLFNAKICHFGAAELCGETAIEQREVKIVERTGSDEITEEDAPRTPSKLKRSDSRGLQFEGVTGYMSPEFQSTGIATQKSDVFAFGVVILELLSGEEPVKFRFDRRSGDYKKRSVIDTARDVVEDDGGGGGGGEAVEGRLRRWVDKRLKDSFPVEVAVKLTRVALDCVHVDPDKRPTMRRVVGKISKLYLESEVWSKKVKVPVDISVSLGPR